MNANELFDLIERLPAEAKCGTIRYSPNHLAWFRDGADKHRDMSGMLDAHAEALQRDAMCEWLDRTGVPVCVSIDKSNGAERWIAGEVVVAYGYTNTIGTYPTRTHALAAACRYVAGKEKE